MLIYQLVKDNQMMGMGVLTSEINAWYVQLKARSVALWHRIDVIKFLTEMTC